MNEQLANTADVESLESVSQPITDVRVMLMLVLDEHESTRWAARIMGSARTE